MSKNICELLKTKKNKDIYCNEIECKIIFEDDDEIVITHDDFMKCFYQKTIYRYAQISDPKHIQIRKASMITHQRNVYEKN